MKRRTRKVDSWGHPALTEAEVIRIVENMIPAKLRPYYIGIDVMKQEWSEPFSEWNTDIEVMFKYPVVGCTGDSRYAHSSLYGMRSELNEVCGIDRDSRTEEYADWDADADKDPVIAIKKMRRRIQWHKRGWDGRI